MVNLKDICTEMMSYTDKLKTVWDDLYKIWRVQIGQDRYENELNKIEKFQAYDCRPTFRIGFVGEQSAGKSIFINELLQKEIVLSGAAEVTFVPSVIVLGDQDSHTFYYYTRKEIEHVLRPYYEIYTKAEVGIHLQNYIREYPNARKISREELVQIKDFNSLKNINDDISRAIYYCLEKLSDRKVARDFVNLVYALRHPNLGTKLSDSEARSSSPTSSAEIERRSFLLKERDNSKEFPEYDRNKKDLYEIYLVHHIYQTVAYSQNSISRINNMEFVDFPGIDAVTIRVRHASLFFMQEVDALILVTDTQKAFTLSSMEILRTLRANKAVGNFKECFFVCINKYDTINDLEQGKDSNSNMVSLESFRHTVTHIKNNIKHVLGDSNVIVFVSSALMTQFFRKEQKGEILSPKNSGILQVFKTMKNNPNLSGDEEIDQQIKKMFDSDNFGGIPYIRQELEKYLQNTSLQLKKTYFIRSIQSFWEQIDQSFNPIYKNSVEKWQSRAQTDFLETKNKLLNMLQNSLKILQKAKEEIRDYTVPLVQLRETIQNEVKVISIVERELWNKPRMELYQEIHDQLCQILNKVIEKIIITPFQEKLNIALKELSGFLELSQHSPENWNSIKTSLERIRFLWTIHPQVLMLRFQELVAEKPMIQLPSYLKDCMSLQSFVTEKKKSFLEQIDATKLISCAKVWHHPLYCIQEILYSLETIQNWINSQTSFPECVAQSLRQNSPADITLQQEYKKSVEIQQKLSVIRQEWLTLQSHIETASY